MDAMSWLPALVATLAGAVAALVASRFAAKPAADRAELEARLRDLEERIEHAVAQLKDFELQRDKIEPQFYAAQRLDYEARAAQAMRERDALLVAMRAPAPAEAAPGQSADARRVARQGEVSPAVGFLAARPALRGALWGGGVVAIVGLLVGSLLVEGQPRAPGGSVTGNAQSGAPAADRAEEPVDPELEALIAKLDANPNDLEALLQLTRRLLHGQMLSEAEVLVQRALSLAPTNPMAQTYEAVLMSAKGDTIGAVAKLDAVTRAHPTLADAWFFRGMLGMQSENDALMRESFEKYVANAPAGPQRDRIKAMLESGAMPGAAGR